MNFKRFNGSTWETVQHKIYGSGTDSLTAFPAVIQASGEPLTDYLISGNAVQDGTPSPESPVDVVGCGVRTENLLDESTASDVDATHINYNKNSPIILTAGQTYTFSCDTACDGLYIRSATDDSNLASKNESATLTYTPQVNVGVYVRVWNRNGIANLIPMLNLGSTALPYEPYGYKLSLTVNGTEYPIYLGQVETTRRIRKYEFTGEENGTIYSTGTSRKGIEITGISGVIGGTADVAILAICTHYNPDRRTNLYRNTYNGISNAYQNDKVIFYDASCQTVEAFRQFCAQQYAAGTPVTVWYVLAEPETGIVNESLMKIGDYADTITMTQAGEIIPTLDGDNTITFGTTVQPSAMSATFKGWHPVQEAKVYDGEEWR